jgi:hypothetical protein
MFTKCSPSPDVHAHVGEPDRVRDYQSCSAELVNIELQPMCPWNE